MSANSGGREGHSTSNAPQRRKSRNNTLESHPNGNQPHYYDHHFDNQADLNSGGTHHRTHNNYSYYRHNSDNPNNIPRNHINSDVNYRNSGNNYYRENYGNDYRSHRSYYRNDRNKYKDNGNRYRNNFDNGNYRNGYNKYTDNCAATGSYNFNGSTKHLSNDAEFPHEQEYGNAVTDKYYGHKYSQNVVHRQTNRKGSHGKQSKNIIKSNDKEDENDNTIIKQVKVEEVSALPAIETQASSLRHEIETNSYECMVCYDTINAFCATYSCFQCHNIFHLSCVRQWALSKLSEELPEGESANWTCPACNVPSSSLPNRYICFCGSVINPKFKSFVLPHSCGEKCTRVREKCSHPCPELCHPGKCPPCSAFIFKYCICNSESKRVKCSKKDDVFKCTKVCTKSLNCKKHVCEEICHSGVCKPCPEKNTLPCYCGNSTTLLPCGDEIIKNKNGHTGFWSCLKKCNGELSCGNHQCPKTCHADDCPPCDSSVKVVTTCACGKTKLEKLPESTRESCLDEIPTCKKTCKKNMACGHVCQSVCHNGPCPPCMDKSLVMCNCKSTTERMNCSEIPDGGLQCEKVCYKKKTCGRHRCNTKCCLEDNHVCMIPCGKLLSCKIHKCEDLCHRGHCMPCLNSNFSEVTCRCGRTKLEPPVPCGTPPPKCYNICNQEHNCDHPVNHNCHYDDDCPICPFLVNKVCMGGHAVRFNIPCHVMDVSCGEQCQKQLPCQKHTCLRLCHKGNCIEADKECSLPCAAKRIKCPHSCNAKCHGNKPCPQTVCFKKLVVTCDCKRRKVDMICFTGATETDSNSFQLSRYFNKLRSAGISVSQNDLIEYLKKSKVPCVENCIVEERNMKMAQGLGLVDVPVDAILAPSYTEYLKQELKTNKAFIIQIEEEFATLITKYKKRNDPADALNKVKFIYHDLKPMNKEKRKLVHELAGFYKIGTQSLDDQPVRNVQLKIDYASNVPSVKLSQYFQKRTLGGITSSSLVKPINRPTPAKSDYTPNLQSLSSLKNDDIVFDSWEDINE